MKSSTLSYWFGRWGLLVMTFTFGGSGALAGYRGEMAVAAGLTLGFLGLLGFAIRLHDRIAIVTLEEGGVGVRRGGVTERYAWSEVVRVSMVPQVRPPTYRVDFHDATQSAYCVVPDFYEAVESFGFHGVKDFSGFAGYARQQALRAGIEAEKARMGAERKR